VSSDYVNVRFREYAETLGLPVELHPHCLRHAYVTHLKVGGVASDATVASFRRIA